MIHEDLRTIRMIAQTILHMTSGHARRNKRMRTLRHEISRIQEHFADWPGVAFQGANTDVREQMTDGLRALLALAHGNPSSHAEPETNREVESRLWLLSDMATFLIKKAEELLPTVTLTHTSDWFDEANDFVELNVTVTPDVPVAPPSSVWDGILREIEGDDDDQPKPGDLDPDDIAF